MYPFVTIFGFTIYMTWLGVALWILIFLYFVYYYCQKEKLDFLKFFYSLPLFLFLPYFFGRYVFVMLHKGILLPGSISDFLALLSPYNYEFHFLGLLLGFVLYFSFFFKKVILPMEKGKWIDTFFFSSMLALVPVGLFLVLGDDYIGKQTTSSRWVPALTSVSEVAKFSKVFPIGLFFSFIAFVSFLIPRLIKKVKGMLFVWYLWFAIFFFGLSILFLFEQYTRFLVFSVGGFTFDINNYIAFFTARYLFLVYMRKRSVLLD